MYSTRSRLNSIVVSNIGIHEKEYIDSQRKERKEEGFEVEEKRVRRERYIFIHTDTHTHYTRV